MLLGLAMTTGTGVNIANLDALTTGLGLNVESGATAITGVGRIFISDHTGTASSTGVLNEFKSAANDNSTVL